MSTGRWIVIDWLPFIKAAIERNPVCFTDLYEKSIPEVHAILNSLPDESIYDGPQACTSG